jgi:hypothetical protein
MDKVVQSTDEATVRLSRREFQTARQSLNQVTNGIPIPDPEFVARLGGSRLETRRLLRRLRDEVDTSGLAAGSRPAQAIGPEGTTFQFGIVDLKLLRNALIEVTKGEEIPEWEYQTRLGTTLDEGKQLLSEVEDLIGEMAA